MKQLAAANKRIAFCSKLHLAVVPDIPASQLLYMQRCWVTQGEWGWQQLPVRLPSVGPATCNQ